MQIEINLSEEQQKALLTEYVSIEGYCQRMVENRANRLCKEIVKKYADDLEGVTAQEQITIDTEIAGRIVVNAERLSDKVKKIIIKRSSIKSMMDKIAEQELLDKPIVPIKQGD